MSTGVVQRGHAAVTTRRPDGVPKVTGAFAVLE